jgi:hypothetical protein
MVYVKMVIDDVLRILKLEHWFTQSLFVLNLSNRTEFYLWCNENSISIIHVGTFGGEWDVWDVQNEQHRMWIRLRWE